MSELALANVEALADDESVTVECQEVLMNVLEF